MNSVAVGQSAAIWFAALLIWIGGLLAMAFDRVKSTWPLVLWTAIVLAGAIGGTIPTVRYYG